MKFKKSDWPIFKIRGAALTESELTALKHPLYITKPVMGAMDNSVRSFTRVLPQTPDACRLLLMPDSRQTAFLYRIEHKENNIYVWTCCVGSDQSNVVSFNQIRAEITFDTDFKYRMKIYSYDLMRDQPKTGTLPNPDSIGRVIIEILGWENFLRYAKIETKILKPGHEIREGVLCKYKSNIDFPVTIVDSTWFTTLVKSDEFKVRGHFRLQPCGHLLKDKRLIWINEFKKSGYTREAKILSQPK